MAARFHFANSPVPLKEGVKQKAVCGEDVPHAAFAEAPRDCMAAGYTFAIPRIIGLCRRCRNAELGKRFVYVIFDAKQVKRKSA